MNYYLKCIKNYANFKGRARRKEYWVFALINGFITILSKIMFSISTELSSTLLSFFGLIFFLYGLFIFLPSIAVGTRRLHDINRSGFWQLLYLIPLLGPIVLIVFFCIKGDDGENRFGLDPLQEID